VTILEGCIEKKDADVRFEVFTAVTMTGAVFWDVAPCKNNIYTAPHPRRRHSSRRLMLKDCKTGLFLILA
jgi:hypothetical protein